MSQLEYKALYTIEGLNKYVAEGWQLVGSPTSSTFPDTDRPATCWTVSKPVKKEPPKMPTAADLARANAGL